MSSLNDLLNSGRLTRQSPSVQEIGDLLRVAARDLADARLTGLSTDRAFATAYNAALQLSTVVLRAEGWRTKGVGHHRTTIIALGAVLGDSMQDTVDFLDACRAKRNTVDYDGIGVATEADLRDLVAEVESLRPRVLGWLTETHPHLATELSE